MTPETRLALTGWPRRWSLIVIDLAAGIAFTGIYVSFVYERDAVGATVYIGPSWFGYVLAAFIGLPVAVRRRWPVQVYAIVLTAMSIGTVLGLTREPYTMALVAFYMVAVTQPRRWAIVALIPGALLPTAGLLVWTVADKSRNWPEWYGLGVFVGLAMCATLIVGQVARGWRLHSLRAAEEKMRQALVDERMRIARELHDVVAHSLSVIAVKAGIAGHVAAEHPDEAADALRVIETISRGSLTEMRRLLGVLRTDEAEAPLSPAPGLTDLPELADRARLAGVGVDIDVSTVEEVPEGLGLVVYRIVQEALTNVVKHAAPAHAAVTVAVDWNEVRVDVVDDGSGHRELPRRFSPEPGHGLAGMRERVALYGGEFTAGPGADGGFAVSARIPYGE